MTRRPAPPSRLQAGLASLSFLAVVAMALLMNSGRSCRAQSSSPNSPANDAAAQASTFPLSDAQVATKPSNPAQAQLIADSERLVQLSRELKIEVDKSTKDTLSMTVVRKAEEIERLARSLKERINKSR